MKKIKPIYPSMNKLLFSLLLLLLLTKLAQAKNVTFQNEEGHSLTTQVILRETETDKIITYEEDMGNLYVPDVDTTLEVSKKGYRRTVVEIKKDECQKDCVVTLSKSKVPVGFQMLYSPDKKIAEPLKHVHAPCAGEFIDSTGTKQCPKK